MPANLLVLNSLQATSFESNIWAKQSPGSGARNIPSLAPDSPVQAKMGN
jgi:hypothetical protein